MAPPAAAVTDPVRLLRLLWHPPEPSPRTGLSVAGIVDAAARVAAADGVEAITMRRVAGELAAAPMSLYSHVPGKAELLELMLDAHAGGVWGDGERPAAGRDRRHGLALLAERNLDAALAHPWTLDLPVGRPVPGPGTIGKYEIELAALDGLGLSDVAMDDTLHALLGLARSAADAQVGLDRARWAGGADDRQWWDQVGPALATAMAGHRFPLADRVGTASARAADAAGDPRRVLHHGVGLLLDGLRLPRADGQG